jgi:hypothetical protein
LVNDFVATLQHFTYSPDLDPSEFYQFPCLKLTLKGRRFCDATDIMSQKSLKGFRKTASSDISNALALGGRIA